MIRNKTASDRALLELVRTLPCMACTKTPSEAHHVTTRGAGGGDTPTNVMPLCSFHHRLWHFKGPGYMIENFKGVLYWLEFAERFDVIERTSRVNSSLNQTRG